MSRVRGHIDWRLQRTPIGHRNYTIQWLVDTETSVGTTAGTVYSIGNTDDGPERILSASGLPQVGAIWAFGNDYDPWAYCWPDWRVSPVITKERNRFWIVEQKFSTEPILRCNSTSIENPLNEPAKLSGTFVTYTREAQYDYNGALILNSSKQLVKGQQIERDESRPTVNISFNSATLPLSLFTSTMHNVNDSGLWGLPARCVKLSKVTWSRNFYGQCFKYFTLTYDFDIRYDTFDRRIRDEGTRVLAPGGTSSDPRHYIQFTDVGGGTGNIILDGSGHAWNGTGSPGSQLIKFYAESNLLLLGIPDDLQE